MKKQTKEKKGIVDYVVAVVVILSITAIIYISYILFTEKFKETSYASTYADISNTEKIDNYQSSNYKVMQTEDINFNSIIEQNNKKLRKEEITKEELDIEYTTKYVENPDLPKGMLKVLQEGVVGKQEVYTKKIYEGEDLIKEESVGSKVTKSSINKLVEIGTGPYTSNYQIKVGDTLYVTASIVAIRIEPKDNANKLISLNKDEQVKLLQKKEKWYKVQYKSYVGWSKAECFTYLSPNSSKEESNGENKYTKQQLLGKLSFNMNLNEPSGLSLEQFKKIFKNESKDKNKIFENNAQYFYYAEKQYKINGVFLASVAIHESAWGTSTIALQKNNLFGYGAYDRNPYNSAYQFSNYSESIDLLGRVFVKYYLNPAGTKIYDGNKASGTYYNGPTLSGVNVRYATDKNWANGVYSWMKYLYNKL